MLVSVPMVVVVVTWKGVREGGRRRGGTVRRGLEFTGRGGGA